MPPEYRLSYGIGIHTGIAMLGNVGSPSRKEFTALGHGVTFAKKLQEIALAGEVIISEDTYRVVQDNIIVEPAERQLRGDNASVMVYKVLGVKK
jgi:adenylate cyclase